MFYPRPNFIILNTALHNAKRLYEEIQSAKADGMELTELYKYPLQITPHLYDVFTSTGGEITVSADEKKNIWTYSLTLLSKDLKSKHWKDLPMLKKRREEIFKTLLIRKTLIDEYLKTGKSWELLDEKGNKVKHLDIK
nr:hypothetical protein [uncultured Flavobacterium sp.]